MSDFSRCPTCGKVYFSANDRISCAHGHTFILGRRPLACGDCVCAANSSRVDSPAGPAAPTVAQTVAQTVEANQAQRHEEQEVLRQEFLTQERAAGR